jgi:5'-nucleotidase
VAIALRAYALGNFTDKEFEFESDVRRRAVGLDKAKMQILLTNDDGIYAPGLAAMERSLKKLGDVCVVAPAVEQSGVGHSITFLSPLMAKEVFEGDRRRGFAVEGSPADCVKLAVAEFCPKRPDLVVSGINGGLNVGINVLYSGTVAGATEGAVFGITSVAVSLEYDEHAQFDRAADVAVDLIQQILAQGDAAEHNLYNINIPTSAFQGAPKVRVVPMATVGWPNEFDSRVDPKGRHYYWTVGAPAVAVAGAATDLEAWQQGFVTVTPLRIDRTENRMLEKMHCWKLTLK